MGETLSAPVQTGPGPTATPWVPESDTYCVGESTGVKRPRHDVSTHPQSSAEVKGKVQLYLYSDSVPSWQVIVRNLLVPQYPN